MTLTIEIEREEDGRWIAEVPGLAGVLCYGGTRDEAIARPSAGGDPGSALAGVHPVDVIAAPLAALVVGCVSHVGKQYQYRAPSRVRRRLPERVPTTIDRQ